MPVIWVSIGLGSGLSPTQHQSFAWTDADYFTDSLYASVCASELWQHRFRYRPATYPVPGCCRNQCWPINIWTIVSTGSTPWNFNQSFIATMTKINLAMSSAVCPPFFYLADNQLIAYVPHHNHHRLHWCNMFLWVMYMLWYFYTSMFGIIVVHWSGAATVVSVLPSLVALESVDRFQCNLCRLWRSFFGCTASVLAPVLTLLSPKWGLCKVYNGKNLWDK